MDPKHWSIDGILLYIHTQFLFEYGCSQITLRNDKKLPRLDLTRKKIHKKNHPFHYNTQTKLGFHASTQYTDSIDQNTYIT